MEFGLINLFGIIIISIMMLPNIFYAVRFKNAENKCKSKVINTAEQIGRYAALILMCIPLGVWKFTFSNITLFLIYVFGNIGLLLTYLIVWIFYFKKQTLGKALTLAIIPTCIFLINGITLNHWLLVGAAVIFGTAHIYITYRNNDF